MEVKQAKSLLLILLPVVLLSIVGILIWKDIALPPWGQKGVELDTRSQTTEVKKSTLFLVQIKEKPYAAKSEEYFFLKEQLEKLLGLSPDSISFIVNDLRKIPISSLYDSGSKEQVTPYYILFEEGPIVLNALYENEYLVARVMNTDNGLIPYIRDPDYFAIDADCTIRTNFCHYGAFNYFHPFYDVWGCAGITYTEFECSTPDSEAVCDSASHEQVGCVREVEYTGVACVDHKCVPKSQTAQCLD